jgi:2-dehydro-3-deoxygluconokinase
MKKSKKILERLKKNRLVALLSPKSIEDCVQAYEICEAHGVILEIAFRSEHASGGIKAILEKNPDALVLAGTVMTEQQTEQAIEVGVAGVVSADYIPKVIDVCVKKDIMCVPGGLSDVGKQLVQKAEGYGCTLEELRKSYPYQWVYKLFPAFSGKVSNLDLVGAWSGPYKDLTIIYTGGMTLETLRQAARKDPQGIFCASALIKKIDDPEKMVKEIKLWKEALRPVAVKDVVLQEKVPVADTQFPKIVTLGELMIRLSPPVGMRLQQAQNFDAHFGGSEANVAVSLAQFGMKACFVSAFPDNALGDNACNTLKKFGVDTSFIVRKGQRIGVYYLEHGHGPRPPKVIYDRAHSAVSELKPKDLDWEYILKDAQWFHWTGITPALSDSLQAVLREGLEQAKKRGISVSVDLNYRKKLWSEEKAQEVMTELMPYVDILIGNEEDPTRVFGIQPAGTDITSGKLSVQGYKELMKTLCDQFDLKKVAITLRESVSASENYWSACLFDGKEFVIGPKYHVWIIDRVGTGDAFAAGLIYSLIKGKNNSDALAFGVASAALKHSVWGDFNIASVEEVERLASGETTGRVQR